MNPFSKVSQRFVDFCENIDHAAKRVGSNGYVNSKQRMETNKKILARKDLSMEEKLKLALESARKGNEESVEEGREVDESFDHLKVDGELKVEEDTQGKEVQISLDDSELDRLRRERIQFETSLREKSAHILKAEGKIDELMNQLTQKTNLISGIQHEKQQIIEKNLEELNAQQNTQELLKREIQNLEKKIQKQDKSLKQFQLSKDEGYVKYQQEKEDLLNTIQDLKDENNACQVSIAKLTNERSIAEESLRYKVEEFEDYKKRAQKLLKEKNSTVVNQVISDENSAQLYKRTKIELNNLQQEYNELSTTFEIMKRQHEAEASENNLKIDQLIDSVEEEKLRRNRCNEIITQLEIRLEDQNNTISTLKSDYSQQIQQLKSKLRTHEERSLNGSESELRSRMQLLAEKLIEKQSSLELVNSEKTAVELKLEKAQQKLRELSLPSPTPRYVQYPSEFEDHSSNSAIPFRTNRVFQSMNSGGFMKQSFAAFLQKLDRWSLEVGNYFRRLPLLRIFFFGYVILLHFYIMIHEYLILQQ